MNIIIILLMDIIILVNHHGIQGSRSDIQTQIKITVIKDFKVRAFNHTIMIIKYLMQIKHDDAKYINIKRIKQFFFLNLPLPV